MSDYISREAAKLAVVDVAQSRENGFQWGEEVTFTPSKIIGLIDKIPAADVRPVVRGKWIDVNGDGSLFRCSVCKEDSCCNGNYCSPCGADMREDQQE